MSNVKKIEIVHKNNKVVQKTTEHAFMNMMDKDSWSLLETKPKPELKPKPKPKPKAKKKSTKKKKKK